MAGSSERPNVVVVHWHDLGVHLNTYGVGSVSSPVVDALAAQGTRFDRAFCTTPLCSPARASLMTGRYPHSTGMNGLAHRGHAYQRGERELNLLLGDHGYRTALFGVQHEAATADELAFDETFNTADDQRRAPLVAERFEGWLAGAAQEDRPFFASVGFIEVHRPYRPEWYEFDDPDEVVVPAWLPDNEWTRDDLAAFQGSIRVADAAVGRVLAALERHGLADNTWLIFTTDHGPGMPGGKSTLFDPGLRVALIQRYPRAWGAAPGADGRLFSHVDLVPTVLDRLGLPVPETVQGVSQAAAIGDPGAPSVRSEVFAEKTFHNHYDPMRCVRTRRHKLIMSWEERPWLVLPPGIEHSATRFGYGDRWLRHRPPVELYDLDADPVERHNLADNLANADLRDELRARLTTWQQATGDPILEGAIPQPPWPRWAQFGAIERDATPDGDGAASPRAASSAEWW
jgi:arylsulfatase A-like enzyme